MTFEDAQTLQQTHTAKMQGKVSDGEMDAMTNVCAQLESEGKPYDTEFGCPSCGIEVNGWMGKEFLMETGVCYGCDQARTDAQADAQAEADNEGREAFGSKWGRMSYKDKSSFLSR